MSTSDKGILFVVGTPIGNLEDLTLRAEKTLREVSLIAAEDTRRTRKLLSHLGISKKIISCREHNEIQCASTVLKTLASGMDVAYVTDAGTPGLSDPGSKLVSLVRKEGCQVVPIPGVSALTTALSVSGLPADSFLFKGFLPAKKTQRKNVLMDLVDSHEIIVFFESPKRLMDTLSDILKILGNRLIVVARELTKIHETILHGKVSEVTARLSGTEIKGEITIVIEGAKISEKKKLPPNEEALERTLRFLITKNRASVKEAAELLSRLLSSPKKIIYEKAIRLKAKD